MSLITYKYADQSTTSVLLEGKKVGKIVETEKGFRYYPKASSACGELFPTLIKCKKSLEG